MKCFTVRLQDGMTGPDNQRTPDNEADPVYRILPLSVKSAKLRVIQLQDALEEGLSSTMGRTARQRNSKVGREAPRRMQALTGTVGTGGTARELRQTGITSRTSGTSEG
jgi:hypothetical protein